MAEIKILKPQVTEIAQTQTPASGSLAIPIGFATAQGDAISKAIKEVGKIYNDQKLEEDAPLSDYKKSLALLLPKSTLKELLISLNSIIIQIFKKKI